MRIIHISILIVASFSMAFHVGATEGSWFIDPRKLHISAHMENSCQDCHEDIFEEDLHPNPADVNRKTTDFFTAEKCLACHDEVMDNLDEGVHGIKKVKNREKYEFCIRCHKPHSQRRLGENRIGKFDPARPRHEQCGACHHERSALPESSPEDKTCMGCHRLVDPDEPEGVEKIRQLCFHCHAQTGAQVRKKGWESVPLIDGSDCRSFTHSRMACTACHLKSAQFMHANQRTRDCRQCHLPHDEKVAHDAHMNVSCEACHFKDVHIVRDLQSKHVHWESEPNSGKTLRIHEMSLEDDEAACKRCHFKGNQVGAVSMILPAKSIMCMPCHTATFSVSDSTTIIALIIFLAGIVIMFSYWLSGSNAGERDAGPIEKLFRLLWNAVKAIFSKKILVIIKTMILDVVLQRRLFRQSEGRWVIHSLIFFPFVFRFLWGLVALVTSLWAPEWPVAWPMLNKNNPATAFLFDMTGFMVLLGAGVAFIRGYQKRPDQHLGLPGQDRLALSLIGSIVIVGFILEGMRIAMTGWPENAWNAVIGYAISKLFSDSPVWTGVYGYIWYIHAILTGAFVAYLPFSRMFHIIMAPVVLAMNAVSEHERSRR